MTNKLILLFMNWSAVASRSCVGQIKRTLAYINNGVLVLSNFDGESVVLPAGEILATTQHDLRLEGELEHDQTVWIKL